MLARPVEAVLRVTPWLIVAGFLAWYFDLVAPVTAGATSGLSQFLLWLVRTASEWTFASLVMPIVRFAAKYWLGIGLLIGGILFFSRINEWHAIAIHTVRDGAQRFEARRRERSSQRAKDRERAQFVEMSEEDFKSVLQKKDAERRWHERRSDILNAEARRTGGAGIKADALRKRAKEHLAAARKVSEEMRRLQAVWTQLSHLRQLRCVSDLIRELQSRDDVAARRALKQLNKIWATFDWSVFIPQAMPAKDRPRLLRFLEMMASTIHLGEARAAYEQARRMREAYADQEQEAA
jgi:hypothetical protein